MSEGFNRKPFVVCGSRRLPLKRVLQLKVKRKLWFKFSRCNEECAWMRMCVFKKLSLKFARGLCRSPEGTSLFGYVCLCITYTVVCVSVYRLKPEASYHIAYVWVGGGGWKISITTGMREFITLTHNQTNTQNMHTHEWTVLSTVSFSSFNRCWLTFACLYILRAHAIQLFSNKARERFSSRK